MLTIKIDKIIILPARSMLEQTRMLLPDRIPPRQEFVVFSR
jgi:hypothetical protein